MRVPAVVLLLVFPALALADDWRQWRGPTSDQHAAPSATAPVRWSETENIDWKTAIPGRGHSSPTVVGPRIYLTTGEEDTSTQSLLILARESGELLKKVPVHSGVTFPEQHPNNSHASPTVACDGQRVFTVFHNDDAIWLTALDLEGEPLWQSRVCEFTPQRFQFGYGASPIVLSTGRVIVTAEYDGAEAGVYAFDASTGQQVAKADRAVALSFSSAIETVLAGREQVLLSGDNRITSYEPLTMEEIWSTPGGTNVTCGTVVWDRERSLVFAGGGVPQPFVLAVKADGSSDEPLWRHNVKVYEQSLIAAGGYVYGVSDRGVAYCWRGEDGQEMWNQRLGGRWSSSPVLVDGRIYVSNESGTTWVFAATPEGYQELAENQLGTDVFATPTPLDGRLYHRYGDASGGERQEYLAAIGE